MPDLSNYPENVRAAMLEALRRDPSSIGNSPFQDSFIGLIHGAYDRTETIGVARNAPIPLGKREREAESYVTEIDVRKYQAEIDTRQIDALPAKERRRLEKIARRLIAKHYGGF